MVNFELHHLEMVFNVVHHFAPYFYVSGHISGSSNSDSFLRPPTRVPVRSLRK